MAEKLLTNQNGEFYPFGAEIDNDGKLTNIGLWDGDDFPLSETMIKEFKKYFEKEISNERIRAYSITFDTLAKRDEDSEKTDAIAIECYSRENGQRTRYYFPYKRLSNDKLEFGDSWGINVG